MKTPWLDAQAVRLPRMVLCLELAEFLAVAATCGVAQPGSWIDLDASLAEVHTWEVNGDLVCVVCLHPDCVGGDPIQVACVLVHEAVHVFQRLCTSIGEVTPSKEFEAYSIEHISEALMREFARRMEAQ